MSPALYAAFVLAVITLMLIPGPNVALIVATSIARGPKAGLATVAGTCTAMAPQLVLTGFGMNALLGGLADTFSYLRWIGVAYLVWLAFRSWTAPGADLTVIPPGNRNLGGLFWRGFFVSLSNPKTLFFFSAFFPQFLNPSAPLGNQIALLAVSFIVLAAMLDSGWALLAAHVGGAVKVSGRLRNRLAGGLLLGAGLGLAMVRRT